VTSGRSRRASLLRFECRALGEPDLVQGVLDLQDFGFPTGPTSNYPTFFFHSDGHGGWTVLGGGAIGDVASVCDALPPSVLAAFQRPSNADSGCPT
jgi:hypothetical protein